MAGKIFISYRRDDSRYQARMIYDAFARGLPRENIFMDVDTIAPGVDFVRVLEGWVSQCEALLVLMGPHWSNSTDPKTRKRRLDNSKDYVRIEIRGALSRDIPVVPILLDGAELPDETELPDDIKPLLNRHAEYVDFRTFDTDVQRLIKKLGIGTASISLEGIEPTREVFVDARTRKGTSQAETEREFSDSGQESKRETKQARWLAIGAAAAIAIASLAAVSIGKIESWLQDTESAQRAAAARMADAQKALQAAELKAAEAQRARESAEAKVVAMDDARQVAEQSASDAEMARKVAQAEAESAKQRAEDAEKARNAAEAKFAETKKASLSPAPRPTLENSVWRFDSSLSGCGFTQITNSDPRVTTILQFWTKSFSLRMMVRPKDHNCKAIQPKGYAELRVGPYVFRSDEVTTCNSEGYPYVFYLLPDRARAAEPMSDGGFLQGLSFYNKASLSFLNGPKFKQTDILANGLLEAIQNATCPEVGMPGSLITR
jgi:hypothetical protein